MRDAGSADAVRAGYASFASFYDRWSDAMVDDVGFYVRRALEATGPVVELAAGTGRIAIPMAAAGRDVIAVDVTPEMIEHGIRRAAEAGVGERITWVNDAMQRFVAAEPTDLVVIPYRSFFHLTTPEDQIQTLHNVAASLVPGGRLAFNLFVPDPVRLAMDDGRRVEEAGLVAPPGRRFVSHRWYRPATQRLDLRFIEEAEGGDGTWAATASADLPAMIVYPNEMRHLLALAGFEMEATYGWFDERSFGEDSEEMVWIARKP